MRVLDGVYAAGADAGNVFEDVYGGGLGWAAVSGRRAGRAAVAHAQRRVAAWRARDAHRLNAQRTCATDATDGADSTSAQ